MTELSSPERAVLILAATVILAAGMKAAAVILVPGLLALFLAIICSEPMNQMIRWGFPRWLAILVVVLALLILSSVVPVVISGSLVSFSEQLPTYQEKANSLLRELNSVVASHGYSDIDLRTVLDPAEALRWVQYLLGALGGILSRYFLILLLIIFILVDWPNPKEMQSSSTLQIMRTVQHYFGIKALTSLLTGILITFWVMLLDIDYPLLWGFLGFILNFIPNIGSFLAAMPPIILALLFQGYGIAIITSIGYVILNVFVSNFIEPRILGQQLGLRFVVIFVSLIFWGYILGPVGMLLAVPLTIILRIVLQGYPATSWMADLLGARDKGDRVQSAVK